MKGGSTLTMQPSVYNKFLHKQSLAFDLDLKFLYSTFLKKAVQFLQRFRDHKNTDGHMQSNIRQSSSNMLLSYHLPAYSAKTNIKMNLEQIFNDIYILGSPDCLNRDERKSEKQGFLCNGKTRAHGTTYCANWCAYKQKNPNTLWETAEKPQPEIKTIL